MPPTSQLTGEKRKAQKGCMNFPRTHSNWERDTGLFSFLVFFLGTSLPLGIFPF